ncbi:U-box domain-containing protein 43, partial [Mucuna pruriens]
MKLKTRQKTSNHKNTCLVQVQREKERERERSACAADKMEIMEERKFSKLLSELIVLADEVASLAKNSEIEVDIFSEFAMLVEKFPPIFNDLRDKNTVLDKPPIRKSLESLENELRRAKALTKSSNLRQPIKQIEDITHDIGRSLGLLLVGSLEVSVDFREKIGTLQRQLMNVRFDGSLSLASSPKSFTGSDMKLTGEIEEEIVNVSIDDVVLQLKNGNDEEFAVALLRLKEFMRSERLDGGLINEEATLAILFNRLGSCKADSRLAIIRLLRSIAFGNDKKKEKMVDIEFLSAVVKSLTRDSEERKEAVGLLLDLSDIQAVRRRIGRIQGCIVMLVAILNGDDPDASHDAAKLLDMLSSNTQNALHMAEAGYFKPLVKYLKEGSDMNKILMATALSRLELTDHSKLSLGEDGAIEPLVNMFSTGKLESKLSALNALQNLSSLTENVQRLIRSGIAGSLLQLLFSVTSVLMTLREPASAILARIADSESVLVNEDVAQQMLSLLNLSSPIIQGHLLEALNNIAANPGASKVRSKMKEKGALQLLLPFLKENNTKIRSKVLNLLYTLSKDLTDELTEHLDETHLINIVTIVSTSTSESEKAAAVGILSNLPASNKKVTDILKRANLLPILISIMYSSTGSNSSTTSSFLEESTASVIIRFTNSSDKKLQLLSAEHRVIPLLVKLLSSGSPITKSRAAISLAQLSQNSLSLRKSRKSRWLCVPPSVNAYCEVHDGYCFVNSTFCLVKAGAVSPLIQLLEDTEREVVESALYALSTLLQDEIWEGGVNSIAKLSGVQAIVKSLQVGDAKVQEKAIWMLERIFKIAEYRVKYGESAQVVLIDLAQKSDSRLKSTVAKVLAELELLQSQSSYF